MPEVTTGSTAIAIKISLFASILSFLEYFGIPKESFGLLGVLMLIDIVTGLLKQKYVNIYGEKYHFKDITSTRLSFGIVKKLVILTMICSLAITAKALGFSPDELLTISIAGFVTAEIYSIIQNGYIIYTGKFLPEFDATGLVLRAIAGVIKNTVEGKVKQIEEKTKSE